MSAHRHRDPSSGSPCLLRRGPGASASTNTRYPTSTDPSANLRASPHGRRCEPRDGDGIADLTSAQAMEATVAQCQQRGLTDTATWLSELLLDATPQLLSEKLGPSPSFLAALRARDAEMESAPAYHSVPSTAKSAAPAAAAPGSKHEEVTAVGGRVRWKTYHSMALGLFHKAEYYRCHHYLMKAMKEVDEETFCKKRNRDIAGMEEPTNPSEGEREEEESIAASLHSSSSAERRAAARRHGPALAKKAASAPGGDEKAAPCLAASFATTRLPPSLLFLCLYALYMDGQKTKTTSANPHRTKNPNLRVLRVLLLEALRNPANHLSSYTEVPWPQQQLRPAFGSSGGSTRSSTASPPQQPSPKNMNANSSGGTSIFRTPMSADYPASRGVGTAPQSSFQPGFSTVSAANHVEGGASTPRAEHNDDLLHGRQTVGLGSKVRLSDCDPYLAWLTGVVLRDLGLRQESATYFLASARVNPLLWCAWEDMAALVSRETQLDEIAAAMRDLRPDFMLEIFLALGKASLGVAPLMVVTAPGTGHTGGGNRNTTGSPASALQGPLRGGGEEEGAQPPQQRPSPPLHSVNAWEYLLSECFPGSLYLLGQLAGCYYHQHKELDRAERLYQQIHKADPYRLDFVADYSNLLFMKSDRLTLASLAQKTYQAAPFRAESNFVVGNYYVLLGQHDRSVLHFRRAVAIQPSFVAAWTLLGHAYVETRNTTAAVEAYRTAVELDPRDYRGWYNLGQIYELLQAYHHALYYYWHTTSLRPMDSRMWTAVANCLEHERRLGESIACLERAVAHEPTGSDLYPTLVKRIATYYIDTHYFAKACVFLEKLVACRAASQDDLLFALPFLVQRNVQEAHQVFGLPARSPSYEPAPSPAGNGTPSHRTVPSAFGGTGTGIGGGVAPGSSTSHNRSQLHRRYDSVGSGSSASFSFVTAAAAADPRTESALKLLANAEAHLNTLSALVGGNLEGDPTAETNSSNNSSAGGGGGSSETRPFNHVERFIHEMRRTVAENRRLIRLQVPP